jgi:RNA polymerase-binding transcription factor DksA
MLQNLFLALFGCRHPNAKRSWPITIEERTYCVCTKCGCEFPFDKIAFRQMSRKEIRSLKEQVR